MNRTYPTTNDIKHDHVKRREEEPLQTITIKICYAIQRFKRNHIK